MLLQFIIGYLVAGVIFSGILTAILYDPGDIGMFTPLAFALLWPFFVVIIWVFCALTGIRLLIYKLIDIWKGVTHDTTGTNQTDA